MIDYLNSVIEFTVSLYSDRNTTSNTDE